MALFPHIVYGEFRVEDNAKTRVKTRPRQGQGSLLFEPFQGHATHVINGRHPTSCEKMDLKAKQGKARQIKGRQKESREEQNDQDIKTRR
jgi:hypothetical protein